MYFVLPWNRIFGMGVFGMGVFDMEVVVVVVVQLVEFEELLVP
jgi:hypothetical protein